VFIPSRYEYLASIVAPREAEHVRLPDPWTREETATYQTKFSINIVGCQGVAQGMTADVGRFSLILNPVFDASFPTFSTTQSNWMVAIQDGNNGTALWSNSWVASNPGTNFITYITDPNQLTFANPSNTGLMMKCRPVSASILASYNGQLINGGGNIAASWLPGDFWPVRAVTGTTNACKWETLAQFKGAYDGPLCKGAYTYWMPEDETDTLLYSTANGLPDRMAVHNYPVLAIAGQVSQTTVTPSTSGNSSTQLRVDCYINWEYTTDSRIVEAMHGSKDINERYLAYKVLAKEASSMANGDHIDWIRGLLGAGLGFLAGGPIGAVVGGAAGLGISLSGVRK